MTGAGAADACAAGAKLVRIATDTDITVDVYGAAGGLLMSAGSAEFFPVEAGQIITVALA